MNQDLLDAALYTCGTASLADFLGFIGPTALAWATAELGHATTEADVRYAFARPGTPRSFDHDRLVSCLVRREIETYRFAESVDGDQPLSHAFMSIFERAAAARLSDLGRARHRLLLLAAACATTDERVAVALATAHTNLANDIERHRLCWIPEGDVRAAEVSFVMAAALWGSIFVLSACATADDEAADGYTIAAEAAGYFIRNFAGEDGNRLRLLPEYPLIDDYERLSEREETILDAALLVLSQRSASDALAFLTPNRIAAVSGKMRAKGHPVRTVGADTLRRALASRSGKTWGEILMRRMSAIGAAGRDHPTAFVPVPSTAVFEDLPAEVASRVHYLTSGMCTTPVLNATAVYDIAAQRIEDRGRRLKVPGVQGTHMYAHLDLVFSAGASLLARFVPVRTAFVEGY